MVTFDEFSSVIGSSSTLETILGSACLIMSRSLLRWKKEHQQDSTIIAITPIIIIIFIFIIIIIMIRWWKWRCACQKVSRAISRQLATRLCVDRSSLLTGRMLLQNGAKVCKQWLTLFSRCPKPYHQQFLTLMDTLSLPNLIVQANFDGFLKYPFFLQDACSERVRGGICRHLPFPCSLPLSQDSQDFALPA